jgi:hypothetical protein
MRMPLGFLSLLFLYSVGALDTGSEKFNVAEFQKTIENKIQKRTLSNGLRVIAMRQTSSPTIACYLKIGVGSANEPFDQSGTAHFLEHLLFKGTPVIGTTNYKEEKVYLDQIEADGERLDTLERTLLNPLLSVEERRQIEARMKVLESRLERWQKSAQKFVISEEDSQALFARGPDGL